MSSAALRRLEAPAVAAAVAVLWALVDAPVADLAAQGHRVALFERQGFSLWDGNWYAGHHVPGYSVLFPALGALIGMRLAAALAVIAGSWALAELLRGAFGARSARWPAVWGAVGLTSLLWSGRLTFALGAALALAAALAAQRRHVVLASLAAAAAALASPVAGAFLALCAAAWWLAGERGRGGPAGRLLAAPVVVIAAALAPVVVLMVLFPEGGTFPFVLSSFLSTLAGALLVVAVLPAEHRVLRTGAVLYALLVLVSGLVASPMGGNASRLGAVLAGPVVLGALLRTRRARLLWLVVPALAYWQWAAPTDDVVHALHDPSAQAGYYAGLIGELERRPGPVRVEVPLTDNHWEAQHLAAHVALARGWERQLDRKVNGVFYDDPRPLTPERYVRWLHDTGVGYVALPDATLDRSAAKEAALVRGRLPELREVWRDAHWRLFAVRRATPIARGARLLALGDDDVRLVVRRGRAAVIRVRWTPYWRLEGVPGCVQPAGEWTMVRPAASGRARLVTSFALDRVRARGPRCSS